MFIFTQKRHLWYNDHCMGFGKQRIFQLATNLQSTCKLVASWLQEIDKDHGFMSQVIRQTNERHLFFQYSKRDFPHEVREGELGSARDCAQAEPAATL